MLKKSTAMILDKNCLGVGSNLDGLKVNHSFKEFPAEMVPSHLITPKKLSKYILKTQDHKNVYGAALSESEAKRSKSTLNVFGCWLKQVQ